MATEWLTKEQVLEREPNASFGVPSVWTLDDGISFQDNYTPGAKEIKMGGKVGDWMLDPGVGKYHKAVKIKDSFWSDIAPVLTMAALPFAGAGISAALGAGAAGAGAGAAIPELGLIANPATANAAIAAGIPASTLSGGAGALSLADIGTTAATGTDASWGINAATEGGAQYGDAIEGLIDLTNQGLTGEQAIAALSEINPAWTQGTLEFLLNNPGELLSSGGSAVKSLLGLGDKSNDDLIGLLGKLGAAGLQAYASGEQSTALADLAKRYEGYGAPSRARFEAGMTPGFDPTSIPGYAGALDTASKGILARLSATGGNPFGQPGGLIDANKQIVAGTALPAINEYLRLNANTGFGSSMNAAGGLEKDSINANTGVLAGLASGLGSLTAPDNSYAALIAKYPWLFNTGSYKLSDGTTLS